MELGTALPSAGGEVTYLKRSFGELSAFLFMWCNVFVGRPAAFAITAIVAGENACRFTTGWRGNECHQSNTAMSLALMCVALTAALNAFSTRASTAVLSITLSTTVMAMTAISLAGLHFAYTHKEILTQTRLDFDGSQDSWIKLGPAFMSAMWAFDGWNTLNYSTEEMVDSRAMKKIIWVSLPIITLFYMCVNAAYLVILPPSDVADSDTLGVDVAFAVLGPIGARIMPVFITASSFGSCVGNLFVGARIVFSSGRDGELPSWLGTVDRYTLTPLRGVLLETLLAIVCLLTMRNIDRLISFFSIATWLFYVMVVLGLLRLRITEPGLDRPSKAPALAIIIFLVSASSLLVMQCLYDPTSMALGFGVAAVGMAYHTLRGLPMSLKKEEIFKMKDYSNHYGSTQ